MIGCCEPTALCEMHRDGLFAQLRGVASTRGEVWADYVAERRSRMLGTPLPGRAPRMMSIARRNVADLARDDALLEMLADELVGWGARRWSQQPRP